MQHSAQNQKAPYFSLVVLCYRSGFSIIPFVEKLHRMLSWCNFTWELILVGNYVKDSDDETPKVVSNLASNLSNVRTVIQEKEGMMGWDMRTGLNAAKGEFIGVIDGDGQFPIESILACLCKIELDELDLVKTYRAQRDDGFYRRLISYVYNFVFRVLFGFYIRDINSKPKIVRRSKYELLNLQSDDWFVDAEIMIRANQAKLKIGEIPIQFFINQNRNSFVKPQAILEFIRNLFLYRYGERRKNEKSKLAPRDF
jgi:glycosyltransferase involved in cell wall biosynthesis